MARLALMKRERSKVEILARSAKVAKVCRRTGWTAPGRSAALLLWLGQVDLGVLVGGVAGRLGRRVDEVQDAGLEGLGRDQPQRERGLALVEQPHALANGDRVQQQVQLVQKTGGHHLADDRDRAAERDVAARLLLQGGHGLDEIALR